MNSTMRYHRFFSRKLWAHILNIPVVGLIKNTTSLNTAEENMLKLYVERLGIQNHQRVLDLGCGWGSFTLFAAEKFPNSNFVAVSNSNDQIEFIKSTTKARSLENVQAIKQDMNDLSLEGSFDRIISVEMFEHMRNYGALLKKLGDHLLNDGKCLYIFLPIVIILTPMR